MTTDSLYRVQTYWGQKASGLARYRGIVMLLEAVLRNICLCARQMLVMYEYMLSNWKTNNYD